jgi:hypothetical protein
LYSPLGHDHDTAYASITHTHDYADLTGTPTIITEAEVIDLIEVYALLKQPDYDSGWQSIARGQTKFDHFLGTTNLLVIAYGSPQGGGAIFGNQFDGRDTWRTASGSTRVQGAFWSVNMNSIYINRMASDTNWANVRVLIWNLDW